MKMFTGRSISLLCLIVSLHITSQSNLYSQTLAAKKDKKVWTVDEILNEKRKPDPKSPIDYCQKGRFSPCVCPKDVARDMRYRPAVQECNGNAAIVLTGKYLSVFSVVVRDSENRDRWPASGFHGCSVSEANAGLAKCSAFKTQDRFYAGKKSKKAQFNCLGASGYSKLFKKVVRVTAKLADIPNSSDDPLARWCLNGPAKPLN